MKISSLLHILFVVQFLSSCVSYEKKVAEELNNLDLSHYDSVILVPGSGCPGCITMAENYFCQNVQDTSKLFIFTNIISLKGLKGKLRGVDFTHMSNIIFDVDNHFYFPDCVECVYPYCFEIKNSTVRDSYVLK